jgi:mannose-1-phosphate guanylyltransferase
MLLKISDKYRVTGESLNFVLQKKIQSKKTPGKIKWSTIGYYSNLSNIASDIIKENIINTEGELKQVIDCINESTKSILSALEETK